MSRKLKLKGAIEVTDGRIQVILDQENLEGQLAEFLQEGWPCAPSEISHEDVLFGPFTDRVIDLHDMPVEVEIRWPEALVEAAQEASRKFREIDRRWKEADEGADPEDDLTLDANTSKYTVEEAATAEEFLDKVQRLREGGFDA